MARLSSLGGTTPPGPPQTCTSCGALVIQRATTWNTATAKAADHSIVVYVETDPLIGAPDSESWWDVPVSETSTLDSTQQARKTYDKHKATQRLFL